MKKIGLVGGTGPESTVMYYKKLNEGIDRLTGGKAMPDIAIESVDFRRAWGYVTSGDNAGLADYLFEKIHCLELGGAEVVSLTAGTMHLVYDELASRASGIRHSVRPNQETTRWSRYRTFLFRQWIRVFRSSFITELPRSEPFRTAR